MVLKVPVFWVWILAFFVVVAAVSLTYFGQRKAETGPGKYKDGTCLRNEELGLISQVISHDQKNYVLKVLSSRKYPDSDAYRAGAERKHPIEQVDTTSSERPVPCPQQGAK